MAPKIETPSKVVKSVVSQGEAVAKDIEAIQSKQIKYGGRNGYFVSVERLNSLQDSIDEIMESGETTKSSSQLIDMHNTITELRKVQQDLTTRLESEKMAVAKGRGDLDQMRKSLTAKEQLLAEHESKNKAELGKLTEEVKLAATQNAQLRKEYLAAKKGYDPELAVSLKAQLDERGQQVASLNNTIGSLRATLTKERASIAADKAHIKKLQDTVDAKHKEAITASKALTAEAVLSDVPTPKFVVSPTVARVLGQKRVGHLVAAAEAKHQEVKDRLYETLQALRGCKDKKIIGLVEVLQVALDWVKHKSYKARVLIADWLDVIIKDIQAAKVKSITYYRDTLRDLIEDRKCIPPIKPKKPKYVDGKPDYTEGETWEDWFLSWAEVLALRAKRKGKSGFMWLTTPIRSFFSPSTWRGVFQKAKRVWYGHKEPAEDIIFDVDDLKVDAGEAKLTEVEPRPLS